jgi:hypothetical protein
MELTASEYCRFGQSSQIKIVNQFGKKVSDKNIGAVKVLVYQLCNFYVALVKTIHDIVIKVELITTRSMYLFYTCNG